MRERQINSYKQLRNYVSSCPLPAGLGWDYASYPVNIGYRDLGNGVRKGVVTGYTPFDTTVGTPYYQCRNGTQIYINFSTGNDTTGDGSLGNPYKTPDKAITQANAAGNPATLWYDGGSRWGRVGAGSTRSVTATVPIANIARNGTVIMGTFANYTYVADGTYAWCYRISGGRSSVAGVYDKTQFDRFGNFKMLTQVASAAICSRVPGSWFMDSGASPASPLIHMFDESAPVDATCMVLVAESAGQMLDRTFGAAPQHVFYDTDTVGDGWEIWGSRIKVFGSAYGASAKIAAFRRVASKYCGYYLADNMNAIGFDNWWGLAWLEECYVGHAAFDSYNFHNTLATKPTSVMTLNCKADDSGWVLGSTVGAYGIGSQNHYTFHEDLITGIDVAGDFNFARGGSVRNIGTSKVLMHGSRVRGDRGDLEAGGTAFPQEIGTVAATSAQIFLSEVQLEPTAGGFAIYNGSGSGNISLRNMPDFRGRVFGTLGTWG